MQATSKAVYEKYCSRRADKRFKTLYIAALDAFDVHWMGEMNATDCMVMYFIIKRTLKFGKDSELIPLRHFKEGVKHRDTQEVVVAGLTLSHNTITAALGRLRDRGLIRFVRESQSGTYETTQVSIDLDVLFEPVSIEVEEDDVGKLRVPRSKKFAVDCKNDDENTSEGGVSECTGGYVKVDMRKQHKVNDKKKTLKPDCANAQAEAQPFQTAKDVVDSITTRHRRVRAAKAEQVSTTRIPKKQEFELLWREGMLQHWPRTAVVTVSVVQWGKLKRKLAPTFAAGLSLSFRELVGFAIENWSTILNTKLHWAKQVKSGEVGACPDVAFFLTMIDRFIQAFNDRNTVDEIQSKKAAPTSEKKLVGEVEQLRSQLAKGEAERKRLADTVRRQNQIMTEMERRAAAPKETKRPLRQEDLVPYDDDTSLGEWNE